jgi:asparagine synthase (glutamine-hydrolysing)
MCGIFGAVFVKNHEAVAVDAALASLAHRGPDSSGVHRTEDAVFGHTRLAVLDLTHAADQPSVSADGQVALVFNGEIYNHHELRAELRNLGHVFRSRGDAEVIVEGYREWGERVVERLDGMFAFGLFDAMNRKLLLARDRSGKKPLFYALADGELRFASEAKAILASGFEARVDVAALPMLLALGYSVPPRSMYAGIAQLAPASRLVLEQRREPEIDRYWRAPFALEPLHVTAAEAAREVRSLVERAVARRLEADVPLGAFLSGGVDSTIIVGVMSRLATERVRTFSIGFSGDARFDETRYARIAAKAFDTEHTEFVVDPSAFDLVERLVWLHDGPFGDSSAIPTSIVSMLTRQHVTVALTGDGGDELFCGYPRFLAAEAAETIPHGVLAFGSWLSRGLPSGSGERSLTARAKRFMRKAALPLPDRLVGWISYFSSDLDRLLTADLRASLSLEEPLAYNRRLLEDSRGASTLSRVLEHNFETYLPFDLLVKADRASMAYALELRSPFLDTQLVEYAARLPDRFRRRGLSMKWILKRAFRDVLPHEIATRGKMGFGVPLGTWFRGKLREYLLDHLASNAELYRYVERSYVDEVLREHFDGRADHGHRIWLLLTLAIWLRSMPSAAKRRVEPGVTRYADPREAKVALGGLASD